MAITYNADFKNEYLNALAPLFEGGTFKLFSAANIQLGEVEIPADAFANASSAQALLNSSFDVPITVAGTATYFRVYTPSDVAYMQGTVGTSGSDLNFAVTTFNQGDTARIQTWKLLFPGG